MLLRFVNSWLLILENKFQKDIQHKYSGATLQPADKKQSDL